MLNTVAGIILAGGQSMRMGGGDKCLRLLDQRPILSHVIQRLRPQVKMLALNANGDTARFSAFNLEVIPDIIPDHGPLGGIFSGMRWASTHHSGLTHILTMAADTPFFPPSLGQQLKNAQNNRNQMVLSASNGQIHPTCALWPISLIKDLETFLSREGATSVRAFTDQYQPQLVVNFPVSADIDPFFNINRPEDLTKAQRYISKGLC